MCENKCPKNVCNPKVSVKIIYIYPIFITIYEYVFFMRWFMSKKRLQPKSQCHFYNHFIYGITIYRVRTFMRCFMSKKRLKRLIFVPKSTQKIMQSAYNHFFCNRCIMLYRRFFTKVYRPFKNWTFLKCPFFFGKPISFSCFLQRSNYSL